MSANVTRQPQTIALPVAHAPSVLRSAIAAALLHSLLLLGACDRGAGAGSGAVEVDTAVDGLSQEQLQQQAQPMSPEQAEQLGIADTTEAEQPSPVGPNATVPVVPQDTAAPPSP